jgi:hypothetical protein
VTHSPVIVTTSTQGTRKARQPYSEQERQALIEQMIEERIRTHSTWEQVAKANNVAVRTVERWRKSDEWRQVENRWRRIMREESRTLIAERTGQAVDVLLELMLDPKTPAFTRMHCARTLLEFGGIADESDEITVAQNDELIDFLKHLDTSPSGAASLLDIEPLPSGLLPPQLRVVTAEPPDTSSPTEPAPRADAIPNPDRNAEQATRHARDRHPRG